MFNKLLFSFVASNSRITVYLKQDEESGEYAAKVMYCDGTKIFVCVSFSLSAVMRAMAETIAQHSNDFTNWRQL